MKTRRTLFAGLGITAALGLAFLAGRAIASGIPATNALTYSGFLENAAGAPIDGSRNVAVELWDAETAGTKVCERTSTATAIAVGRFSVALPDACTTAVKANRDVWVQVSVDGTALGRTKLGAVPYAVEADRAQTAVSATSATNATSATSATNATTAATANAAGGALDTRIRALENALPSESAFLAYRTTAVSVASGTEPIIPFDLEAFDTNNEYVPGTGVFTAKAAGYYDIGCNVMWNRPNGSAAAYYETGVFVNDVRTDVSGGNGDGYSQTFRARTLLRLAVGDDVTCRAYQNSGTTVPTMHQRPGEIMCSFSVIRLAP